MQRRWRKGGLTQSLEDRLQHVSLGALIEYVRWRMGEGRHTVGSEKLIFEFDRDGNLRKSSTSEKIVAEDLEALERITESRAASSRVSCR